MVFVLRWSAPHISAHPFGLRSPSAKLCQQHDPVTWNPLYHASHRARVNGVAPGVFGAASCGGEGVASSLGAVFARHRSPGWCFGGRETKRSGHLIHSGGLAIQLCICHAVAKHILGPYAGLTSFGHADGNLWASPRRLLIILIVGQCDGSGSPACSLVSFTSFWRGHAFGTPSLAHAMATGACEMPFGRDAHHRPCQSRDSDE